MAQSMQHLSFENTACKELRVESGGSNQPRQVDGFHYSLVSVSPLKSPSLVGLSKPCCELLELDPEQLRGEAEYLVGNLVNASAKVRSADQPIAHCYVGHQFGNLAGQLGDGRAISLGDIRTSGSLASPQRASSSTCS